MGLYGGDVAMRIISIVGVTKTGKTTTIEKIIGELVKRRYSVGSIKEIHNEQFSLDTPGSNTDRHRIAGSLMVVARGIFETDVLIPKPLGIEEIFDMFNTDWVICEGVEDANIPKIVTARHKEDIECKWDQRVIAISGVLSSHNHESYLQVPFLDATTQISELVDYIEKITPHRLPNMPDACCKACGMTCKELLIHKLNNPQSETECELKNPKIECFINGKAIPMVPFVQSMLKNAVLGVVKELDGFQNHAQIEIKVQADEK